MSGGVIILDYDRDGWPDIYFTNAPAVEMALKGQKSRGALYHNNHDGTFSDLTDKSGLSVPCFAMGGAVGDYDNDGWPDLYGTRLGGNVLFHNNAMAPLLTSPPKRALPMAAGPPERPSVITTAMVRQTDEIHSGGSYLSQNDLHVHFGLGEAKKIISVEIRWPSGKIETLGDLAADQYYSILEGQSLVSAERIRPAPRKR